MSNINSVFTRNSLREILGESVTKEQLDAIFNLYQSSISGTYISKVESNNAIEEAITKYKADNPTKSYSDFDEYKSLKKEYDDMKLDNVLREAKVKARYLSVIKQQIDQADVATSLKKAQEEFPEMFEGQESTTPTAPLAKPSISTEVQQSTNTPDASKELYDQFLKGMNGK